MSCGGSWHQETLPYEWSWSAPGGMRLNGDNNERLNVFIVGVDAYARMGGASFSSKRKFACTVCLKVRKKRQCLDQRMYDMFVCWVDRGEEARWTG